MTLPSSSTRRTARVLRVLSTVGLAACAVGWALFLRPPVLGGSTTFVVVLGASMEPTMHSGDLVLVREQATYAPGDVVAFRVPAGEPGAGGTVIHRIKSGSGTTGFVMQGDNRTAADLWHPTSRDVLGSSWVRVPSAGRLLTLAGSPLGVGLVAGLLTFLVALQSRPAVRPATGAELTARSQPHAVLRGGGVPAAERGERSTR